MLMNNCRYCDVCYNGAWKCCGPLKRAERCQGNESWSVNGSLIANLAGRAGFVGGGTGVYEEERHKSS